VPRKLALVTGGLALADFGLNISPTYCKVNHYQGFHLDLATPFWRCASIIDPLNAAIFTKSAH